MRVLHVIDTLGVGGAEQMLVNLLPPLKQQGHDVSVAVLRPPFTLREALEDQGVPVRSLEHQSQWSLLSGARAVARAGTDARADIIHAHLLFPGVYVGLARMLPMTPARTCITYHNLAYAPGCNRPGPGLTARRTLNAMTSRFGMDGRTAVSNAVASHYQGTLHLGPITVIPNPIPVSGIDKTVAPATQTAANANREIRILVPGRLVREKGHAILITALAQCIREGLSATLVIAGDGPLRADIERQIKAAGLAARTRFTGTLPHAALLAEMVAAEIVVVPSLFEGFGMTAAEAMALRRCVIAARAGGLTDVIDDDVNGLLFAAGDAGDLAKVLARAASDAALRQRLGEAGRSKVEAQFDVSHVAKRLSSFYADLLRDAA